MKKKNVITAVCIGIIIVVIAIYSNYGNLSNVSTVPSSKEANKNLDTHTGIKSLDEFYNTALTQDKDIRNLDEEYGIFDAQEDGCYVEGMETCNDDLYKEFMNNYREKKDAFIRVVRNTKEGDLILNDVMYHADSDRFLIVMDNTRDAFAAKEDKKIQLKVYTDTAEYRYNGNYHWILYDKFLTDKTIEDGEAYLVTTVNVTPEYST